MTSTTKNNNPCAEIPITVQDLWLHRNSSIPYILLNKNVMNLETGKICYLFRGTYTGRDYLLEESQFLERFSQVKS